MTKSLPYPEPSTSAQYAADLVSYLDAPLTRTNVEVTQSWVNAESGSAPGWNGLGTTLQYSGQDPNLPASTPFPGNTAGVQEYATLTEGLQAARDMMLGTGPQTTALAPRYVQLLRSGKATPQQLTSAIRSSAWAGKPPDTYDANTVSSTLASGGPAPIKLNPGTGPGSAAALYVAGAAPASGGTGPAAVKSDVKAQNTVPSSLLGTLADFLGINSLGDWIIRGFDVVAGAGLMSLGIIVLVRAMSQPNEPVGQGMKAGLKSLPIPIAV